MRQNVNAPESGVDAVGNRDVHQPVFCRPNGTAGLARSWVSGNRRVPCPPPMMTERTLLTLMGLAAAVQHNLDYADNILPPATAGQAVDAELYY